MALIPALLFSVATANGQQHINFKPDTAVNHINLNDFESTEQVLGKSCGNKLFEQAHSLPRIEIVNKARTQVLRLFFHYGGSKNSVDEFELVAIDSSYKIPKQVIYSKKELFLTSNKIHLGINKKDLVNKLGNNYKSDKSGNDVQLTYILSNKSNFVRRYNQYQYYIKCVFRNDILIKYSFGFESV